MLYLFVDLYWKTFRNTTEVKLVYMTVFVYFAEWSCESFVFLPHCSLSLCCLFRNQVCFVFPELEIVLCCFRAKLVRKSRDFLAFWISPIRVCAFHFV